jgi:hypothetical protein
LSRSDSKKVVNQGLSQSKQDQANAQSAFGGTTGAIGDYKTALTGFMAGDPYKAGGEYDVAQRAVGNNVAAAGQNAVTEDINNSVARTGENRANAPAVIAESPRNNQRSLANFLANTNADRIGKETAYQTTGLEASSRIPSMYSGLYGPSISGASSNLGVAGGSAKVPSFWDEFGQSFANAAGKALASGAGAGAGA